MSRRRNPNNLSFTDADYWSGWLPDARHINALPDPVRKYIHDLETRCDPAGDIRELTLLRDQNEALQRKIEELAAHQQSRQ